ncbi:hypothetical protein CRE_19855 [Caenorhabditis remanei]|uniref:BTB domain-containing protein n=1 Tax=Caenorhabditis remanei TaxID=31234 RepID=E3MTA5_CAERE|nr:hypothetical protein CRE_19855 [Caenorhabditis remanei]
MSETPASYESIFAQSDKTDAILVVEEKKLHVNKALLSHHSDYFKTLFNTDSGEKSPPEFTVEFPILRLGDHFHPDEKVKYFATVLSLVQDNPIKINEGDDFTVLLKLAEHFQLSQSKRVLELALIQSSKGKHEKIELADKYKLDELFNHTLSMFDEKSDFIRHCNILRCHEGHLPFFETLSVEANVKLFYKLIEVCRGY